MAFQKVCPPDKIYNPASKRCVLKTGKVGKKILLMEPLIGQQSSIGKKCPPDKVLNPESNRCVSKTGKIGRKVLEMLGAPSTQKKPTTKKKKQKPPVKPKKAKKCKVNEILNPENNQCYSLKKKLGKDILKKKFFNQHEKRIKEYIDFDPGYDKNLVDSIIDGSDTLRDYIQYENYFYRGQDSLTQNKDFANKYYEWNKFPSSQSESIQKAKTSIVKGNKYDFSTLQEISVPFIKRLYSSASEFQKKVTFSSVQGTEPISATANFRFPLRWMIEQMAYFNKIPKEELNFLKYYTQSGFREINTFLRTGKVQLNYRNREILQKVASFLFFGKEIDKNMNEHLYSLYSIVLLRINEIIKQAPPLPEDVLLFKGLKQKYDANYSTFISTSFSTSIGRFFQGRSCCKTYFVVKKGTRVLALFLISVPNEKEVLLPYDIHLRLIESDSTKINADLQKVKEVDVYEAKNT